MSITCPHCQSKRISDKNIAKRAGGVIGAAGGAASGVAGA